MDTDNKFSFPESLTPANHPKPEQNANPTKPGQEKKALWPPTNEKLPMFKTSLEIKHALKEKRDKITSFVDHQSDLAKAEDELELAENPEPEAVKVVDDGLRVERQRLREKLFEEGMKEHQRMRKEKWEKAMTNELYLLNDTKREQILDHKLKNPKSILDKECKRNHGVEKRAPIGDLKSMVSQKLPRTELEELLSQPMLNWNGGAMPKRPIIVNELRRLFRKNIGPSLAVVVDGKQFYCHSMLLGLVSAYFHNRNIANVLHLPENKISSRSFVTVYRWMLEPIRSINLVQLVDLLRAAKFLSIDELSRQCWRLAHDVLKSRDRVLTMYITAQLASSQIEKVITPYVGRVWLPYAASKEFIHLTFNKVRRFLQLDCLAVNSEMEVMYTAILWLQGDWPARKHYAIDLMSVVRFDMMPFVFLLAFERRHDGPEAMRYLQESIQVRKLVFNGLGDIHSRNDKNIGGLGGCPRDWIYDPCCPYHHSKFCTAVRFASFSEFTNYIIMLQNTGYPNGLRIKSFSDTDIVCC